MTVVLDPLRHQGRKKLNLFNRTAPTHPQPEVEGTAFHDLRGIVDPSERDVVSLLVLRTLLRHDAITYKDACTFLLHTTALQYVPLTNRRPSNTTQNTARDLICSFTQGAASLLRDERATEQLNDLHLPINLADLLDGFLIATLIRDSSFCSTLLDNGTIRLKHRSLLSALSPATEHCRDVTGIHNSITGSQILHESIQCCSLVTPYNQTVLPFKNAVFDKHLAPVHLQLSDRESSLDNSKVFHEISHWHNPRRPLASKILAQKLGYFGRRRNDLYMAEMHAYAASLTDAAGKILEPEIVVVKKSQAALAQVTHGRSMPLEEGEYLRSDGKSGKLRKKSGKTMALEAAATIKAAKMRSKGDIDIAHWKGRCEELCSLSDLRSRYLATRDYATTLHHTSLIRPEVELYKMDCLLRIWLQIHKCADPCASGGIAALVWNTVLELLKSTSGMTPEVSASMKLILNVLRLPSLGFKVDAHSRPLEFTFVFNDAIISRASMFTSVKLAELFVPGGPKVFQLEHCGPYLEREIGSAVDEPVPFRPDAWQRRVLDAIDENHSLFVIAPTSAGKTFVSFYAMKQILMADDDSVVVYVAPTKALVNQIAAEIQARFSKSFKRPGKSVWAIHTRDYRINNATGCQILVTVPHILQIMLLAPSNAIRENAWSCRIKRIIFDEIHCIGQAEDGVIWEQLLLQSPCPIIALSATVGNPEEFSTWLGSTQEANGNKLVTIEHHHRYSDLRKFTYVPPKKFCFAGLPDRPTIDTPGLDGSEGFGFIHPVSSLNNRLRGIPEDLNLEARDCLTLWQTMRKHASESYCVPIDLSPEQALPDVVKKIHIFQWEKRLKDKLLEWINDANSPFEKVQRDLSKTLSTLATRDLLSTKHRCDGNCNARSVKRDSLSSIVLPALTELHSRNGLPAIIFNYDRGQCESLMRDVIKELEAQELIWKKTNTSWKQSLAEFERFKKGQEADKARNDLRKEKVKKKAKRGRNNKGEDAAEEKVSRLDRVRETASIEHSKWHSFDPRAPINGFHFSNKHRLPASELETYKQELRNRGVPGWLVSALNRGIGVHHAGMNRKYRQVVEILFRKGYLQVVIATGTLALGINMPCRTVLFAGDSIFLTALNFRQCAGRAGRRGFDLLGNVVFLGIPIQRVFRLISSRLPDLNGHFPITTALVLRLATLLHGSNNSEFAIRTINSILSQPRLYLGSPKSRMAVLHHCRFSIEYLRRQSLLGVDGAPLNFAACVSHLYYTENSAWAFHALLSSGYFHDLCENMDSMPDQVRPTLMLVLSHIFGRHACKRADEEFVNEVVKRSSSIVFLPPLPEKASLTLQSHNEETLATFCTYVKTFADQHLEDRDDILPLSLMQIGQSSEQYDLKPQGHCQHRFLRSSFVSLSGHSDEFDSISDLCDTVRSGIFLEEAAIPYLPIHPESTVPLNAYLYDFYKHGDLKALEKANGIRKADIWFHLNGMLIVFYHDNPLLIDHKISRSFWQRS